MVAGSTPEEEVQTILMEKREMVEKVVRKVSHSGFGGGGGAGRKCPGGGGGGYSGQWRWYL